MGESLDPIDFIPWVGMALALLSMWGAMRARRLNRLLGDTPTCKTIGVFLGLVEVKGTAEAENPVIGTLSGRRCVHYRWSAQERWSRTRLETYTDSKGRMRTRIRHESGWITVAEGGESIPFYIKDDLGVIRIVPDGAKIEPLTTFSSQCGPSDALYYDKGPRHAVAHSDHVRQFTEEAIPLHTQLYVIGTAREREDIVAAEIAHDRNAPVFLISTREEKAIRRGMAWTSWSLAFLAGLLTVGGWAAPGWMLNEELDVPVTLTATGGFLLAWALCWVWMAYNSLARLHQRVNHAWSHIDVELRRRHDLIPQLLRVITGLRDYERTVQTEVAHLRSQVDASAPGEFGPDPQACARDLLAIREAYPELKANESFLRLQEELVHTENRIALARTFFNEIAGFYNTRLLVIPDRFVAKLGRFEQRELMRAEGFERAVVDVDFAA